MNFKNRLIKIEGEIKRASFPYYLTGQLKNMSDDELAVIAGGAAAAQNPKLAAVIETLTDEELFAIAMGVDHILSAKTKERLNHAAKTTN